jgi:hypothetical protein
MSLILCFFLGVFWEVKYFNQKWFHHYQLESYSLDNCNSSGGRLALLMGVAPGAIVKFLFEYRLKISSSLCIIF